MARRMVWQEIVLELDHTWTARMRRDFDFAFWRQAQWSRMFAQSDFNSA